MGAGSISLYIILLTVPGVLVGFMVHEWAHAWAAYALGDPTARHQGRLSLNPFKHLDPVGTLMALVIGYGWGKAVLFDPRNLRRPERDTVLVSAAGPLANFVLGVILTLALAARVAPLDSVAAVGINLAALVNLNLFFFNILPFPPLDGSQVLMQAIPAQYAAARIRLLRWGSIALVAVIALDTLLGLGILPIPRFSDMTMKFFYTQVFGGTMPVAQAAITP